MGELVAIGRVLVKADVVAAGVWVLLHLKVRRRESKRSQEHVTQVLQLPWKMRMHWFMWMGEYCTLGPARIMNRTDSECLVIGGVFEDTVNYVDG